MFVSGSFLLDSAATMYYSWYMLSGIRIFTSDEIWRSVLADFNATLVDGAFSADVDFDSLNIATPISPLNLKTIIINATDNIKDIIVMSKYFLPILFFTTRMYEIKLV